MKKLTILTMSMASGGAEKVISLLLKQLVKEYEVTLYLFYNSIHYTIPEDVKIVFLYKDARNRWLRRLWSIPKAIISYAYFLRYTKQDISLSFLYRPNIVAGILAPFFKHTKFIISERNYASKEYSRDGFRGKLGRLLLRYAYNRADVLFSNSEHINVDLKDNFGLHLPMTVIYNPIEMPKRQHEVCREQSSKIVAVGRFVPIKNHALLFRALTYLPNHSLTIWGDGALRTTYEQTIGALGVLDRISLPGTTKQVLDKIVNQEIFVLSSFSEGFPNVLLEAMSVGLPVIATNCLSGPLELLNDNEPVVIQKGSFVEAKYGILINVDDTEGLVAAVRYLSSRYEKRVHYATLARERSQQYTLPYIYAQLRSLIEQES